MYDHREADRKLFINEMLAPLRLILLLVAVGPIVALGFKGVAIFAIVAAALARSAWVDAASKRFKDRQFKALWEAMIDKVARFKLVLKNFRKEQLGSLKEMELNVERTQLRLYESLRKADHVQSMIELTERPNDQSHIWTARHNNHETTELYKMADKNIAEYRKEMLTLRAGVERVEAQSAVFLTTLDSLRARMLTHHLGGATNQLESREFLGMISETRLQLDSIEKALDELNFNAYPVDVPPPIPRQALASHDVPLVEEESN